MKRRNLLKMMMAMRKKKMINANRRSRYIFSGILILKMGSYYHY
jgi:hypothetical protein